MAAGNALGFSFQPGSGDIRGGGAATPSQGVSQPIQTLSLRLPTQESQNAIAPQSLLQGSGASATGLPDTQLLKMLLQALHPQMGGSQSAPSMPSAAAPYDPADYGRADNGPQDYASQQMTPSAPPRPAGGSLFGDLGNLVRVTAGQKSPDGAPQPLPITNGGGGPVTATPPAPGPATGGDMGRIDYGAITTPGSGYQPIPRSQWKFQNDAVTPLF